MPPLQRIPTILILAVVMFVAVLMSVISYTADVDSYLAEWRSGWLLNLSTELIGALITFVLFDRIVSSRSERQILLRRLKSTDEQVANHALRELRLQGYLTDGSLGAADMRGIQITKGDFQAAVLHGSVLTDAQLANSNFQGVNAQRIRFNYAQLWFVNLRAADLQFGHFQGADFQHAYLQRADLRNARLMRANFQEANLQNTKLQGANMRQAKLLGAKLEGAVFDETTVMPDGQLWTSDIDLSSYTQRK